MASSGITELSGQVRIERGRVEEKYSITAHNFQHNLIVLKTFEIVDLHLKSLPRTQSGSNMRLWVRSSPKYFHRAGLDFKNPLRSSQFA